MSEVDCFLKVIFFFFEVENGNAERGIPETWNFCKSVKLPLERLGTIVFSQQSAASDVAIGVICACQILVAAKCYIQSTYRK